MRKGKSKCFYLTFIHMTERDLSIHEYQYIRYESSYVNEHVKHADSNKKDWQLAVLSYDLDPIALRHYFSIV